MRRHTTINVKDLKKLDWSKLMVALYQCRETRAQLDFYTEGKAKVGLLSDQLKEFSEEVERIVEELQQRKAKSPFLGLNDRKLVADVTKVAKVSGAENKKKVRSPN